MSIGSKYLVLLLFFSFLALFVSPYKLPQEFVDIPENVTYNESTELPLMSNQDDLPAENKLGWWKHTGDSSVSYAGGINGSTIPDDSEEIPEFPNLVIPMMAILCMSLIFGKNK